MRKKEIQLSAIARKSLGFTKEEDLMDFDLQEKKYDILYESKSDNIEIEESDIAVLQKNEFDSTQINFSINGEKVIFDKDQVRLFNNYENQRLDINAAMKNEKDVNFDIFKNEGGTLKVNFDDFSDKKNKKTRDFILKHNIKNIDLIFEDINEINDASIKNIFKSKELFNVIPYFSDSKFSENGFESLRLIQDSIKELTGDIKKDDSDISKFTKIYYRLGKNIIYDEDLLEKENDLNNRKKSPDYVEDLKDNILTKKIHQTQNLSGLITQRTYCAGYAEMLKVCLKSVGIKSRVVIGKIPGIEGTHAWNQVQIDGKWYNTDLTFDRGDFLKNMMPTYMLREDKKFIMVRRPFKESDVKCEQDYSREKLGVELARVIQKENNRFHVVDNNEKEIFKNEEKNNKLVVRKNGIFAALMDKIRKRKMKNNNQFNLDRKEKINSNNEIDDRKKEFMESIKFEPKVINHSNIENDNIQREKNNKREER